MSPKFLSVSIVLLLAGCATVPEATAPAPKQHLALKAPPAVAPPIVAPAIAVTKQTFRQRWLSKFFRSRAQ